MRKLSNAVNSTRKLSNLSQFMSQSGLKSPASIVPALNRSGQMQQGSRVASLETLNRNAGQGRYALPGIEATLNGGMGADPFAQPGGGGQMGSPTGGGWDAVNQWNGLIQSAIERVAREKGITVPGNVVKAVMKLESGGVNTGCNAWGYCGLMQTGPGSWIDGFDASYNSTPEGNIYFGVQELANWYNAVGTGDWVDGAAAYFSGWNYDNPGVSDGYGTTVGQYRQIIQQNLSELGGAGGSMFGGGGSGGSLFGGQAGGSVLQSMFPNSQLGYDFGVESSNGLYGYGTAYGLSGTQHTGMDNPAPLGSPMYAPGDAVVVCVGCWRNDHITGGVGRIELEMPDGARILYDHSFSSAVQVGQRVQAGTLLGTTGGMYSPHTHLEVRVPDPSQSSGYRLVDPAAYFGGGAGFAPQGGGGASSGGGTGNWALNYLLGM
jgi:hypothetical protein